MLVFSVAWFFIEGPTLFYQRDGIGKRHFVTKIKNDLVQAVSICYSACHGLFIYSLALHLPGSGEEGFGLHFL